MKKVLLLTVVLALVSSSAWAQSTYVNDPAGEFVGYFVSYFANNAGPVAGAPDQVVRIINTGTLGTPLTSPRGDICANIYVFDNNQEMIACCAEQITPNELDSALVGSQLTANPLTSVVPPAGVIKVLTMIVPAGGCDARNLPGDEGFPFVDADVSSTHLQVTGGLTYVTEAVATRSSPLGRDEFAFLPQACAFTRYLGSGKGTCTSSVPGH